MNDENLPTDADISPTGGLDLDEKCALDNFLGKSFQEAETLLMENAFYYREDFMCMGGKAFSFYFPAFFIYLKSPESNQDSDAVNAILGIVEFRLEWDLPSIKIVQYVILEMLNFILENYSKFDIDSEIYGDFQSELKKTIKRVKSLS